MVSYSVSFKHHHIQHTFLWKNPFAALSGTTKQYQKTFKKQHSLMRQLLPFHAQNMNAHCVCSSDRLRDAASRMRMSSRMAGMLILDLGFVKEANVMIFV